MHCPLALLQWKFALKSICRLGVETALKVLDSNSQKNPPTAPLTFFKASDLF